MNWPGPGSDEQPEDERSTAPGDDVPAPSPGPTETAAEVPPNGYEQLRSEHDGDEGRWQHREDPAAVPSVWSPPVPDEDLPPDDDGSVVAAPSDGAAPTDVDTGPAGTREDDLSGVVPVVEGRGFARPASSPHTGSWDAAADEVPGDPEPRPASEVGHGEGDPVHVDDVPGFASPPTEVGTFHGEHEPTDPSSFHGERPDPAAPPPASVPLPPSAAVIEDTLAELGATERQATVICVANQKGGVGKTTTTVSLGAALAMEGAQVLVVDLDPQGNATTGLGLRAQEGAPSTYRVIVEQMDVEDATEPTAVRGLHVLPSSLDLAGAEIELVPAFSRENRLKQALDAVRDLYDVILIDCPPSLGLLTINALVAADQVLVPIQCEYYALEGLGQLMRTVKLVGDSLNRGLAVGGVVLTMFDGRTNLSQQVVDEVRNYFGDIAYQTIVPRTVRLSEAPSYGQPIAVFDASSRGARAYQRLAREVARRLGLELEAEEVSPLDRLLGSTSRPAPEAPLPTDLEPDDVPSVEASSATDEPQGAEGPPEHVEPEAHAPEQHTPEHHEHHEPQHHEGQHHEQHEPEHHESAHHDAEHHEHQHHDEHHHDHQEGQPW